MATEVVPSPAFPADFQLCPSSWIWPLGSSFWILTLFPLPLLSSPSVPLPIALGSLAWTAQCHLLVSVQASHHHFQQDVSELHRGAGVRCAVTLELDNKICPPFKWVLFKYWLNNYWVGLGYAKKGLFIVLFWLVCFPFYPQDPLTRGRAVYI